MGKLILIRHGESLWNQENRFTGWVDIGLTEKGEREALEAGKLLIDTKLDHAFTSVLERAIKTTELVLEGANQPNVPVTKDAALNERMYGDLQGLNKAECAVKFGADQVHIWRRSFDVPPPNGESLKDTAERTLPFFDKDILPMAALDKTVLVSAHGNSLRAIVMQLDKLTREEVLALNIPNAVLIIYDVNSEGVVSNKVIRAPAMA
jgi:2,3-bisphosphoglycerate-dependent phosphoglycerate mutase